MNLREMIDHIGSSWLEQSQLEFKENELANFIRRDAPSILSEATHYKPYLKSKGSAGAGQWADVPWIALLDEKITDSTQKGYYIVYLYASDARKVFLTLAQGVTMVSQEYGANTKLELRRRADIISERILEFCPGFVAGQIDLKANTLTAELYECCVGVSKAYDIGDLPSLEKMQADLQALINAYALLFSLGGTGSVESVIDEPELPDDISYAEAKKYAQHFKIERNANLINKVKQVHDCKCKACGFDFELAYGEHGKAYIEAHHLTPISSLKDGQTVTLDPSTDFAVLCANCHRMVHRKKDRLLSIEDLKAIIDESYLSFD